MSKEELKTYINDGSDRNTQEIISKLKFISRIREGEILDTKTMRLQEWDLTVSAYRTFIARNQSRDASLEFYRSVITEAFTIVIKYLEYPEGHFLHETAESILTDLDNSRTGLRNHAKTYESDSMHVAKVEALIETLDTKLAELRVVDKKKSQNKK